MKRVLIIGCGGSGKSTLSQKLHKKTGLPLIHLDQEYWHPGWVESTPEAWEARVTELIARPAWIMDGNYGGTMEMRMKAADTVIFLDVPTRVSLFRVVRRTLIHLGRTRKDMPEGCPERFQWAFFNYVAGYRRTRRPGIYERIERLCGDKEVIILEKNRQVTHFLKTIAQPAGDSQ